MRQCSPQYPSGGVALVENLEMAASERIPTTTKQHFLAGTTAGLVTSAVLHPVDLVKVRYQVYDNSGNAYQSLFGAFRTIVKEESVFGLFQGLVPAAIASTVSWGGYFYFYEHSKKRKLGKVDQQASDSQRLSTVDHLLSGVEAGSIMVFLTNPLWLIKTRLQTQNAPGSCVKAHPKTRYNGLIDAIQKISIEEGFMGFYRGVIPALFLTSHGALQFAAYEQLKFSFNSFRGDHSNNNQPAFVSMAMGVTSKLFASTLTYPYQVIKTRLQQRGVERIVSNSSSKMVVREQRYSGVVDCATSIAKKEGMKGFFRGLAANCVKVAPSAGLTFLVYEECLKLLRIYDPI